MKETQDDFNAELENAVNAANEVEQNRSQEQEAAIAVAAEDSTDDLDEDQQMAFESIMAQIEGQADSESDADIEIDVKIDDDHGENDDDDIIISQAQAAPIETVDADAPDNDPNDPPEHALGSPDEASGDAASDADDADLVENLDEDQQKAFESIMAQIESGDDDDRQTDSTTASQTETGHPSATENTAPVADDPSAISDNAETDPVDNAPVDDALETAPGQPGDSEAGEPTAAATDSSDADLDDDQQRAFESIMAQIESGEPDDADQKTKTPVDPKSAVAKTAADPLAEPVDPVGQEDNPPPANEIKAITPEPASVGKADPGPQAAEGKLASTVSAKEKPTPKQEKSEVLPEIDKMSTEDLTVEDRSVEDSPKPQPGPPRKKPQAAVKLTPQNQPTSGRNHKKAWLGFAVAAFLFTVAGGAYFYFDPFSPPPSDAPAPHKITETVSKGPTPADTSQATAVLEMAADGDARLSAVTEALVALRNQMNAKKNEIAELRDYYQAGIDAEFDNVTRLIGGKIPKNATYPTIIKDPHIRLALEAIQRRNAYIRKLVTPQQTLDRGSEELLFLLRRAELLGLMIRSTSDIDIDGFVELADTRMADHQMTLSQLNIDSISVAPLSLEEIWQTAKMRLAKRPSKDSPKPSNARADDTAFGSEICAGDFSRNQRLTQLSPEVAKCLSTWDGKDLFLNGLTELTAEAAQYLAAWKGDWLGLNALEELTPEAARHLAKWQGKGLSLNGLSRLSPQVVSILSEWQGDQIELVNLKHMVHWDNPKTQLFLPEAMSRKFRAARK